MITPVIPHNKFINFKANHITIENISTPYSNYLNHKSDFFRYNQNEKDKTDN